MIDKVDLSYSRLQNTLFYNDTGVKYKVCRKGRRAGITRGGQMWFFECALDGLSPLLWVDTINANIDRYYERYFLPDLKKLPKSIPWSFNQQKRELNINGSIIDFRSADKPENLEGFGYKKIFLNEAGIILRDNYLYTNAILPMLIDFPDSQLIAAGVPKGKYKKDGTEHIFYQLYKRAVSGDKHYKDYRFTSYDNPFLREQDIKDLEMEMAAFSEDGVQQEIYGEFVEQSGDNPFAHQYEPGKHESRDVKFDPAKQIVIHMDFNLNPMAIIFSHIWQDSKGLHDHQFDEVEIKNASIPRAIETIKYRYDRWIQGAVIGGDLGGKRGDLGHKENWSFYKQILSGLGMSEKQLKLQYTTEAQSRNDVNYVLKHYPDFKINPETCPNTCRDMKNVQCDAFNKIVKRERKDVNQRADFLDCVRYKVAAFHRSFIDKKL